ncbi:unnamed protein product [Absidia cylindrospora]
MAQPSFSTCNNQPVLLSHRYPSPKLDASLPPLSQLLTTGNNSSNNTTQLKSDALVSGEGYYSTQPPSTVLTNTDTALATSVGMFDPITPSVTTTDTTGYVLTSTPLPNVSAASTVHTMQNTTPLYMNDPTTAAAAMNTAATMMYGPTMLQPTTATTSTTTTSSLSSPSLSSSLSSSSTSSSMDPLLLSAAVSVNTGLDASVPYFYPTSSLSAPYNHNNNNTTTTTTITRPRQSSISSNSSSSDKVYSFVAIPGMDQKKRPRRRYDEIERLYHCTFSGCKKSYGTLNHLNSHVLMQSHGPKRHPSEFKEMRKEWRRQRKQREQHKKQAEKADNEQQQQQQQQQQQPPTLTTVFQPPSFMSANFPLQSMPMPGFY